MSLPKPHSKGGQFHAVQKRKTVPGLASLNEGGVCMYAVIATGGKQYRVKEGDVLFVEKLAAGEGEIVEITDVLAVGEGEDLKVGTPFVDGAKAVLKVVSQGKAKKIIVFKYKPKKNYRRKTGHRQPYTKVTVEKIEA